MKYPFKGKKQYEVAVKIVLMPIAMIIITVRPINP